MKRALPEPTDHGFGSLLYICAAHHNIIVCIVHVLGVCNDIADLSLVSRWTDSESLLHVQNLAADNIPAWPIQSFIDASCSAAIMV